jgi:3-hydroxyisobutyrate dehydrogenase
MRVAVLGTGTMGAGMARTLLRNGFGVTVWNRTRSRAAAIGSDGAVVAGTAAEAVAEADVIITMSFDEEAVTDAARDFLPHAKPGAVWLQSATVGPTGMRRIAELADPARIQVVDAPVVGTKGPAEAGTLIVLVSGSAAAIAGVRPVLEAVGSKIVEVGEAVGAASSLKLACNAWIASLTTATGQSLTLAKALGVDPGLFLSTIKGGPSDSGYAQLKGHLMLESDFTPSFALGGLVKDINLMLAETAASDFDGALLRTTNSLFQSAIAAHGAGEDIAAVVTSFGADRTQP